MAGQGSVCTVQVPSRAARRWSLICPASRSARDHVRRGPLKLPDEPVVEVGVIGELTLSTSSSGQGSARPVLFASSANASRLTGLRSPALKISAGTGRLRGHEAPSF